MKIMRYIGILLLSVPCAAQTLYLTPQAGSGAPVPAQVGAYVTVISTINGQVSKGATWTTTGGTLVDGLSTTSHVCTANGPCTEGLTSSSTGTFAITATNGSLTETGYVQFGTAASPVSSQPHLLITSSMLSTLQARAVSGNQQYQAEKTQAIAEYNTLTAAPISWSWTATGGSGLPATAQYTPYQMQDAMDFAYMALVDPSDSTYNWKSYAHDVYLYNIANVTNGNIYMGPGNEWSDTALPYAVTGNWLLGAPGLTLTTGEQNTMRAFMAYFLPLMIQYGNGTVLVSSLPVNSSQQFNTGGLYDLAGQRGMGNNYTFSRDLLLVALPLTFADNTTADPPLTNTCSATRYQICPDYSAGSLHAYYYWWAGSYLLKTWAHLDDPNIVLNAYNTAYPSGGFSAVPTCSYTDGNKYYCFSDGRNGESSEGSWYGYSRWRLVDALAMMHTAGEDSPATFGPQVSLEWSSYFDQQLVADRYFLTGFGANGQAASPGYNFLATGDSNTYVRSPNDMTTEANLWMLDSYSGRTDRTNAEWWLAVNTAFGGPSGTSGGCTSYCGFNSSLGNAFGDDLPIPLMIATATNDLTVSPPSDPGAGYPTDVFNPSYNQHQELRSGYSAASDTIVSVYGNNSHINHEYNLQGDFDVYSNGEYISKGRTVFDNYNTVMAQPILRNGATYTNYLSSGTGCPFPDSFYYAPSVYGGQWIQEQQQVPYTAATHSEQTAYSFFSQSTAGSYNGCFDSGTTPDYLDVTSATRDILYLRAANQVLYYDRSVTGHSADKSVFQNTTGAPTLTSGVAHWLTRSGNQKANFTSLLPASPTVSTQKLLNYTVTSAPYSNLQNGTTMQLTCTGYFADGTNSSVTTAPHTLYTVDDPSIITVSSTGLITAVGTGTSNVYCSAYGENSYGAVTVISGSSSGTWSNTSDQTQTGDPEPYDQIQVDAGNSTGTQFLNTLEWGSSSYTPTTTSLVQSTAGQGFDCAKIGTALGCFQRTPATFTGTTMAASGTTTVYVADTTPNTNYSITGAGTPSSATSDNAGVLTFAAAGTGNITVGTSGVTAPSNLTGSSVMSGSGKLQ
jgi:hypothetical protein